MSDRLWSLKNAALLKTLDEFKAFEGVLERYKDGSLNVGETYGELVSAFYESLSPEEKENMRRELDYQCEYFKKLKAMPKELVVETPFLVILRDPPCTVEFRVNVGDTLYLKDLGNAHFTYCYKEGEDEHARYYDIFPVSLVPLLENGKTTVDRRWTWARSSYIKIFHVDSSSEDIVLSGKTQ